MSSCERQFYLLQEVFFKKKSKAWIQFPGFFLVMICLNFLPYLLIENPGKKEHKGESENLSADSCSAKYWELRLSRIVHKFFRLFLKLLFLGPSWMIMKILTRRCCFISDACK